MLTKEFLGVYVEYYVSPYYPIDPYTNVYRLFPVYVIGPQPTIPQTTKSRPLLNQLFDYT